MARIILGFVSQIAAGKGTVCQYLKDRHQASVYRFSTIMRDILNRIYLAQSRNNLQVMSLALRQHFGDDILASAMAKDVGNDINQVIAIDGIRRLPDIKYLKDLPGFHLISIVADQKIRYERLTKWTENPDDKKKTFTEFQRDELQEAELQIQAVADEAEFAINNEGTAEDLYRQVEEILSKIRNSKQ